MEHRGLSGQAIKRNEEESEIFDNLLTFVFNIWSRAGVYGRIHDNVFIWNRLTAYTPAYLNKKVKGKSKFTLGRDTKAHTESRGIALPFL